MTNQSNPGLRSGRWYMEEQSLHCSDAASTSACIVLRVAFPKISTSWKNISDMSAASAAFCISGENGIVNSPDRFVDEVERQGVLPQPLSPRLTGDHWEDGTPTILTKDNFYSLGSMCLLPLWDPTWWSAGGEHQGAGRRSWSID